jgi:hypothetical protein
MIIMITVEMVIADIILFVSSKKNTLLFHFVFKCVNSKAFRRKSLIVSSLRRSRLLWIQGTNASEWENIDTAISDRMIILLPWLLFDTKFILLRDQNTHITLKCLSLIICILFLFACHDSSIYFIRTLLLVQCNTVSS